MVKDALKSDVVLEYKIFDLALNFGPMAPAQGRTTIIMLVQIQGNVLMLLIVIHFGHNL